MRQVCFLLFILINISVSFAQTNGEGITNTALLVRRFSDWKSQCNSYWDRQFDRNGKYIGSDTYEDYIFQQGAVRGICMALSEMIDYCISINIRRLRPDDYAWLTEDNSNFFYRNAQKDTWYDNLSETRKIIFNRGYQRGYWLLLSGRETRFPAIWEWRN